MPYIKPEHRYRYDAALKALVLLIRHAPPGEVTFCLTVLTDAWLRSISPVGYTEYAVAIGILETAKLELYRRLIAPYEDKKKSENGDAYQLFPAEEDMH